MLCRKLHLKLSYPSIWNRSIKLINISFSTNNTHPFFYILPQCFPMVGRQYFFCCSASPWMTPTAKIVMALLESITDLHLVTHHQAKFSLEAVIQLLVWCSRKIQHSFSVFWGCKSLVSSRYDIILIHWTIWYLQISKVCRDTILIKGHAIDIISTISYAHLTQPLTFTSTLL